MTDMSFGHLPVAIPLLSAMASKAVWKTIMSSTSLAGTKSNSTKKAVTNNHVSQPPTSAQIMRKESGALLCPKKIYIKNSPRGLEWWILLGSNQWPYECESYALAN